MKKRLLITSALMTAVLGASLATGTYAWYTATASVGADRAVGTGSISAKDPNYTTAAVSLPLNIEVIREDAGKYVAADETPMKGLELGQYTTPTGMTAGFYHAYWQNGAVHYSANQLDSTHLSAFASYKVVIKAADSYTDDNGTAWTKAQIAEALEGEIVKVDLAAGTETVTNSRAMFYGGSTSTKVTAIPTAAGSSTTTISDVALTEELLNGDGVVVYFGLYINGDDSGTADTADVSGDFTVTVLAQ